jgi:hypothetical protein
VPAGGGGGLNTVGGTEARLQTELPRIPGSEEEFFSFL